MPHTTPENRLSASTSTLADPVNSPPKRSLNSAPLRLTQEAITEVKATSPDERYLAVTIQSSGQTEVLSAVVSKSSWESIVNACKTGTGQSFELEVVVREVTAELPKIKIKKEHEEVKPEIQPDFKPDTKPDVKIKPELQDPHLPRSRAPSPVQFNAPPSEASHIETLPDIAEVNYRQTLQNRTTSAGQSEARAARQDTAAETARTSAALGGKVLNELSKGVLGKRKREEAQPTGAYSPTASSSASVLDLHSPFAQSSNISDSAKKIYTFESSLLPSQTKVEVGDIWSSREALLLAAQKQFDEQGYGFRIVSKHWSARHKSVTTGCIAIPFGESKTSLCKAKIIIAAVDHNSPKGDWKVTQVNMVHKHAGLSKPVGSRELLSFEELEKEYERETHLRHKLVRARRAAEKGKGRAEVSESEGSEEEESDLYSK